MDVPTNLPPDPKAIAAAKKRDKIIERARFLGMRSNNSPFAADLIADSTHFLIRAATDLLHSMQGVVFRAHDIQCPSTMSRLLIVDAEGWADPRALVASNDQLNHNQVRVLHLGEQRYSVDSSDYQFRAVVRCVWKERPYNEDNEAAPIELIPPWDWPSLVFGASANNPVTTNTPPADPILAAVCNALGVKP